MFIGCSFDWNLYVADNPYTQTENVIQKECKNNSYGNFFSFNRRKCWKSSWFIGKQLPENSLRAKQRRCPYSSFYHWRWWPCGCCFLLLSIHWKSINEIQSYFDRVPAEKCSGHIGNSWSWDIDWCDCVWTYVTRLSILQLEMVAGRARELKFSCYSSQQQQQQQSNKTETMLCVMFYNLFVKALWKLNKFAHFSFRFALCHCCFCVHFCLLL